MKSGSDLVLSENVQNRIVLIRGQKVMLDADLARLYGVPTKRIDEQFAVVFEAIRELMKPPEPPPKRRIGFGLEERRVRYSAGRRN